MKIFGIGLSRTGTHSLASALGMLGFSCVHYPECLADIQHADASVDIPVASAFELLDACYPGSRFIYTVRDLEEWLDSASAYFLEHKASNEFARKLRMAMYGTDDPKYDDLMYAEYMHRSRIMRYFNGRKDLLTFNVKEGWEPLCDFLKKPVPAVPFPWLNKSRE